MKYVLVRLTDCSLRVGRVLTEKTVKQGGHDYSVYSCRFLNEVGARNNETKPSVVWRNAVVAEYVDEFPCDTERHNYGAAMNHLLRDFVAKMSALNLHSS